MIPYIVEFLGTFFFLLVILRTKEPWAIAIGLLAVIYLFQSVSGAHFNPAVSVMMTINKTLEMAKLPFYILAQILGGVAAFYFNRFIS